MTRIRHAAFEDLPSVHALIRELAEYEQAPDAVSLTLEQFQKDFKADNPPFRVIVADLDGFIAGMALYFYTYSTWRGLCLYLEDMIVTKAHRRQGLGRALFENLLSIGSKANVARMAWQVLDWNTPAIRFYQRYNAWLEDEWLSGKLTDDQIREWAGLFNQHKG